MQRVLLVLSGCVLAGCGSSTGILPAGPDTYTITDRGAGAQRHALTAASEFCAQNGKEFVPNMMGQTGTPAVPTGYAVTFRCLPPNDPAVAAFRLQQAPNVVVEQRNR
jgi:hypothetical protein